MSRTVKYRAFVILCIPLALMAAGCKEKVQDRAGDAVRSPSPAVARLLVRAQDLSRQGDHYSALALTDSAKSQAPNVPDVHFLRGRIFTEVRRFSGADKSYRKVLSLDPEYQGAWLNMGNNAFRQKQFNKAIEYYQQEQSRYPTAAVSFHMGRAYAESGKLDSAITAFERALTANPSHAAAYNRLGEVYEEKGNLQKALSYSKRALEQEPENANYRYRVGALLVRTSEEEEALEHLHEVIRQRSWHYGAHYNVGQALLRLERRQEAERFLNVADSLEKVQAEVEKLQSVANMNPNETAHWVNLGNTLHRAGRFDDAVEAYAIALTLAPQNLAVRTNLAVLKAKQGDLEAAISQYRTVLREAPGFVDVWFNLGVAHARLGQYEKARQAWQNVLRHEPRHTSAQEALEKLPE